MNSTLPLEARIWTAAECGEYLGVTAPYFLRVTAYAKDFPPRLASLKAPRWSAKAVVDWVLR